MGKGQLAGVTMGKAIAMFLHLMYQKDTAGRVLAALIEELQKHTEYFKRD